MVLNSGLLSKGLRFIRLGELVSKDFEINCHNKKILAKRYRVTPFYQDIEKEEYKSVTCPVCENLIIERLRISKKVNGHSKRRNDRLSGKKANEYLHLIKYFNAHVTEIINYQVETGAKSNTNWIYQKNGNMYDLNDKAVTIQADFTPKKELSA